MPPKPLNLIVTQTPIILLLLFLKKKLYHQTYKLFLEQKHHRNSFFQNHKFTSPLSSNSHYSLNHLYTIGEVSNYDPVKQYYILIQCHDPNRPLFVPQEVLNGNDVFLLPTHAANSSANFFPKLNEFVEIDDHSRSLYTSLLHKHYSIAQLIFISAKFYSFTLKKQYEHFPATTNISDEINKALPKFNSSSLF